MSGIFHEEEETTDITGRKRDTAGQNVTGWSEPGEADSYQQLWHVERKKMRLQKLVTA